MTSKNKEGSLREQRCSLMCNIPVLLMIEEEFFLVCLTVYHWPLFLSKLSLRRNLSDRLVGQLLIRRKETEPGKICLSLKQHVRMLRLL